MRLKKTDFTSEHKYNKSEIPDKNLNEFTPDFRIFTEIYLQKLKKKPGVCRAKSHSAFFRKFFFLL